MAYVNVHVRDVRARPITPAGILGMLPDPQHIITIFDPVKNFFPVLRPTRPDRYGHTPASLTPA